MPGSQVTEGGCLCGQVCYRFSGDPLLVAVCHCRHCQKQSGSAFGMVAAVPDAVFDLAGAVKVFHDKGETGRAVDRHFCPECGSPILSRIAALPGLTLIKAGTFDDPSRLAPSVEVYCDSALSFVSAIQGADRHARSNI